MILAYAEMGEHLVRDKRCWTLNGLILRVSSAVAVLRSEPNTGSATRKLFLILSSFGFNSWGSIRHSAARWT